MKTDGWLINSFEKQSRLYLRFKTTQGNKLDLLVNSLHYFYLVPKKNMVEELAYKISLHPNVVKTEIELKKTRILSDSLEPVLKISINCPENSKELETQLRNIEGVLELAETKLPYYFKFIADNQLSFFKKYEIAYNNEEYVNAKEIGEQEPDNLVLASLIQVKGLLALKTQESNVEYVTKNNLNYALRNIDILFASWFNENQIRKKLIPAGLIHCDLREDVRADMYFEINEKDNVETLDGQIILGKRRLTRLIELSRITGVKPDIITKITPGSLNTFIHAIAAKQKGFLVPDKKKLVEAPKTLLELMAVDKGGTILYPSPGTYENVAKCDFASMYPSIICKYNISPDTLNCSCCSENKFMIKGIDWHGCRKIEGIIPTGLEPVLLRRLKLKHLKKQAINAQEKQELNDRQGALKTILVTCFGYLGFSNFAFSNVECKEAVVLIGRFVLEQSIDIANEMGLTPIYGIVDSLFVKNGNKEQYEEFVKKVSEKTGISLELNCIFKKIAFPQSSDGSWVANKYYGITNEGEIESRGISLRHSDSCKWLKEFDKRIIPIILSEDNEKELLIYLNSILNEFSRQIRENDVCLKDLAITKRIRGKISEYTSNAPHLVAYRQLPTQDNHSKFIYTTEGPKPIQLTNLNNIDKKKYQTLLQHELEALCKGITKQNS